jgi:hypothetical protein
MYESTVKKTPPQKKKCKCNSEWETQFSWIVKCPSEENSSARCKLCNINFTVSYDGIEAVTKHASTQKHRECARTVSSSQRLTTFFTTNGSQQSEYVTVAELAHNYHGVKHQISFLAQHCAVSVMKQVFQDSEIVKKCLLVVQKRQQLSTMFLLLSHTNLC